MSLVRSKTKVWLERYDCRLNLSNLKEFDDFELMIVSEQLEEECPTEALEDELCEEERYKDLYENIRRVEEDIEKSKKAEIPFSYESKHETEEKMVESSSEEEIDEPFQVPEGIKLPFGMNLPESMKENAVIERTATFVVEQGAQMEIVIKAKQRGNSDQFAFLDFDHSLNPYYKYVSKLIREKKYVPKLHVPQKRPKPKKLAKIQEERKRKEEELLTTSVNFTDSEYSSDDDGHYLHPLLMGGSKAKTGVDTCSPMIGPKTREQDENGNKDTPKTKYVLGKANDMYSSLFNNLTSLVQPRPPNSKSSEESKTSDIVDLNSDGYAEWYVSFYGEPPSHSSQPPIIPTPPDLTPTVNSAAEYAAKFGFQAEQHLLSQTELNLHFLNPSSQYYAYYQSRVRYYQWCAAMETHNFSHLHKVGEDNTITDLHSTAGYNNEVSNKDSDVLFSPGNPGEQENVSEEASTSGMDILNPPPPPVQNQHMNRKMRRRGFHEPPSTLGEINKLSEVGLVEPQVKILKVQSSPAMFSGQKDLCSTDIGKKPSAGPISFSLIGAKVDDHLPLSTSAAVLGADEDDDETNKTPKKNSEAPFTPIPPPPSAPVPLSSGELALEGSVELQNERKLKARLFMERILNEKRAAKVRADQQKAAAEKAHMETAVTSSAEKDQKALPEVTKLLISKDDIDKLIKSKIDKVLHDSLGKSGDEIDYSSPKSIKKESCKRKREETNEKNNEKLKRRRKESSSRKHRERDRRRYSSSSDDYRKRRRHKSRSSSSKRYRR